MGEQAVTNTLQEEEYLNHLRAILMEEPCTGPPPDPSQLLPHVYIGSQNNAESLRLLRRLGITHVLNCAGYKGPRPYPNASPYEGLGIDYLEFQAEDIDTYDIRQHFPESFTYLDKVKREGGVCLVHCALGINRSGAVCMGYVMQHKRVSLLAVARAMKKKRRLVLCNRGFQRQLVRWARTQGLLDTGEKNPSPNPSPARRHNPRVSSYHQDASHTNRVATQQPGCYASNPLKPEVGASNRKPYHEVMAEDFLQRSRDLRRSLDVSGLHGNGVGNRGSHGNQGNPRASRSHQPPQDYGGYSSLLRPRDIR